jgi:hypothetical protein
MTNSNNTKAVSKKVKIANIAVTVLTVIVATALVIKGRMTGDSQLYTSAFWLVFFNLLVLGAVDTKVVKTKTEV